MTAKLLILSICCFLLLSLLVSFVIWHVWRFPQPSSSNMQKLAALISSRQIIT